MTLLPAALLLGVPGCGDDDDDDDSGQAGTTSAGGSSGSGGTSAGGQAGSGGSAGASAGTSSGTAGTSAGTAGTSAGAAGSGGAAAEAQSDAQLAGVLAALNDGEIDQGELAVTRALEDDVAAYGTMMVTMHTDNQSKLDTLLQGKGLALADSAESQAVMSKGMTTLTQLQAQPDKSEAFDMAYLQSQVTGHQDALALLDDVLLPKVQDADLKAHFTQTRADVVMHLEHAQMLMDGAGGASGSGGMAGMSGAAGMSAGGTAGAGGAEAGGASGASGQAGGGTAGSAGSP